MTLHWWMHWFWITLLTTSVCVCSPVLSTAESPDVADPATTAVVEPEYKVDDVHITTIQPSAVPVARGHRGGKAIGQPPPNPSTVLPNLKISLAYPLATSSDTGDEGTALQKELSLHLNNKKVYPKTEDKSTTPSTPLVEEKTNITEHLSQDEVVTEIINLNVSNTSNASSDVLVPNNSSDVAETDNVTMNATNGNITNSAIVEVSENKTIKIEEPMANSTNDVEISTVQALLLETNVGRRAADGEVRKNAIPNDDEGLDAGAVAGICFGSLVILGLAGAISLVLYRRRYLNKPQTLNDKCSNPDSSGYIDDSTMRENSEEMYSLDNDSFLNSLEAMTIQNYWTDSVKHTKL